MSDFGPVLRKFRKAARFSQERLAGESGVSVEAIKALEAGRRRHPRLLTLRLLGNGLGLTNAQRAELVAAGSRTTVRIGPPHELPDDIVHFNGREQQVAELEKVFTSGEDRPGVVVTSAVVGMGGIGKTALAVHVAHRVADRYPDGQLYLNLRGFGPGRPMTAEEALGRLMDSLGLQAPDDPGDVHEAAARYRSALANRRVLVLLDNAVDAAQVAPLLPGASTCAVLITSRTALTALPGATHLMLEVLPDPDAVRMLGVIVGDHRIADDPVSALSIARLCGALPLALHIAGGRLADEPSWTAADLNRRLESSRHRLDELSTGNRDVRASIEFSLAVDDTTTVDAFKLLGLHEGDELDVRVAAALLDLDVSETEQHLERLVDLQLVESLGPRRYRLHDLIRSYVQETTATLTTASYREAARLRVLRLYYAMGWRTRPIGTIDALLTDWSADLRATEADDLSQDELFRWFDGEIEEIIAAAQRAANGTPAERATVAKIVIGLVPYLHHRRRYDDGLTLGAAALAAEESVGDPFAAAALPFELAQMSSGSGLPAAAVAHMTAALATAKLAEYPDLRLEGQVYLAGYMSERWCDDEAFALATEVVEAAARRGARFIEAEGRLVLGQVAGRRRQTAVQDDEFRRAVELVRRDSDHNRRHMIAVLAGVSLRDAGRYDEALAYFDACRTAALDGGSDFELAEALEGLGRAEAGRGHLDTAEHHLRAALKIIHGTWQPEARVREHLGHVLNTAGRRTEAKAEWTATLDLLVRHGSPQAEKLRELLNV